MREQIKALNGANGECEMSAGLELPTGRRKSSVMFETAILRPDENEDDMLDFEDILDEVGAFGWFQKRLVYFFLIPTTTILPMMTMATLFMISTPDHWCMVPELANLSRIEQSKLIRPPTIKQGLQDFDSCKMFDIDYGALAASYAQDSSDYNFTSQDGSIYTANDRNNIPVKECPNGWRFDDTFYDETAATAMDLVCDRASMVSWVLSADGVSKVVGTIFFGWISDKFGRRTALWATVFTFMASTVSPLVVRNFWVFLVCRFINGSILPAIFTIPYVIMTEIVGPSARSSMIGISWTTWTLGSIALPLAAYLTRDWVWLTGLTVLLSLVYLPYWNLIPESPRWLLSQNEYTKVYDQIKKIAITNGRPVPDDLMQQIKRVGKKIQLEEKEVPPNPTLELISRPGLRWKFFVISLVWLAGNAAYYGITMNSFNLHGNEFINFALLAAVELPSDLVAWWMMTTKLGRRWSNFSLMSSGGLFLMIPSFLPPEIPWLTTLFTLLAKSCTNASFMVIYQQAAELLPTQLRNQGMGAGAAIAALANVFLPYITFLGRDAIWIPLTIIGSVCLISGFIASFLPETLEEVLPDSIEEAANFGSDRKYFSLAITKPRQRRLSQVSSSA